ncbi:MAG: substrate-binding domain-containing protein [Nitriliruptorales bacterium]|nr:substrate-binding domain-containing protein [Nitriliruptorales bacterium]
MKIKKTLALAVAGMFVLTACADDEPAPASTNGDAGVEVGDDNPDGRTVRIAFSFPGADHGWLAAITNNATAEADRWDDVEFIPIEGTNDSASQASQVETLINESPDALIILPHEGDALTPVALEAMKMGIPVINVDREFSTPAAYRTWIGGDNYGIGKAAGEYIAEQLDCSGNVVEIQGLAGISVTDLRTQGFADAIAELCGDGIQIVAQQPADFLPDRGLEVMEAILQAQEQIDAVYTHDDDMAEGVVAAIENAGREDEMFVTGAGGSSNAFDAIAEGGLYKATFLYNPSMAASAVRLARLIALGAAMDDLVEPEVPSRIQLPATTVTAENVESLRYLGY